MMVAVKDQSGSRADSGDAASARIAKARGARTEAFI